MATSVNEVYSPREIALAARVSEEQVLAALRDALQGPVSSLGTETRPPYRYGTETRPSYRYVRHVDAVRIGRALVAGARPAPMAQPPLFDTWGRREKGLRSLFPRRGVPLAVSSTVHASLLALVAFIATLNLAPQAAVLRTDERLADPLRLVFLAIPGPGGGGGGGGLGQPAPPPKTLREGHHTINSPVPPPPPPIAPTPAPPDPLKAEQLPAVVAPIVTAPADNRNRIGVLERTEAENESHGPGSGGGAGTGTGTGIGEGRGSGVGPGWGGGTGGGPYRPGSGIAPPRLLREVKADYTEEARQRGVAGDVVLEIVVRRDGTVGDVKILQGLGGGLNERAAQAVRQWRFAPAERQGVAVDVMVEVAVEFRLR